jgi:aldehyde:ferredoxin oxidoreductase
MVEVAERSVLPKYGGMEYETIAANGSLCGVSDLKAIAEASQWINRYVLDSISTGVTIAFAMECFENGILTKNDADGIDLTWGNADALIQMIHKIARREGIGDLLADGVKVAAARLGHGAESYALHVKGQELAMHDPRGKVGLGIAYAVSPTGADHMQAPHDPYYETWSMADHEFTCLGLLEPVDRMDIGPKKVRAFYYMQTVFWLFNSIGMCDLVGVPIGMLKLEKLQDFINAVTGWNMSIFEMMKVGERANTMARIFNIRVGFTAAEDNLPDRMFEPIRNGRSAGKTLKRDEMAKALELYYAMCGWDRQGVPTPAKLAELDLSWTLDE